MKINAKKIQYNIIFFLQNNVLLITLLGGLRKHQESGNVELKISLPILLLLTPFIFNMELSIFTAKHKLGKKDFLNIKSIIVQFITLLLLLIFVQSTNILKIDVVFLLKLFYLQFWTYIYYLFKLYGNITLINYFRYSSVVVLILSIYGYVYGFNTLLYNQSIPINGWFMNFIITNEVSILFLTTLFLLALTAVALYYLIQSKFDNPIRKD